MIPKYRVWDTVKKAMSEVQAVVYTKKKVYPIYSEVVRRYVPFSEAVLMQSTGLKDTNGVEIFDGDLIQLFNGDVGKVSYNKILAFWEVQFNNGELNLNDIIYFGGEVIGNIYEDKHLLEE